ncbi:MAG: protein-tyrosine-phosphatase [Rhodothermaceae bacterium]|nr:MAG: protein-tyrosine-phosphatase [Rhodothermaceae bacterium]
MSRERVLFVCTHNSARSQMAEGLLRALHGDRYEVYSAGTVATRVHPLAIEVMREIGIDISGHRSEHLDVYAGEPMDYVVTVCDAARESCPYFPARKRILHHSFPDPSAVEGTEEERRAAFRQVRDAIRDWLETTFAENARTAAQGA